MRTLLLLITVAAIYILAIMTSVYGRGYSFVFNMAIVPVMLSVLFFTGRQTSAVLSLSVTFTLGFLLLGLNFTDIVHTLLFLVIVGSFSYYVKYIVDNIVQCKRRELDLIKDRHAESKTVKDRLQTEKEYLEKMVYDISNLYQAPKKMTSATSLQEFLKCAKDSLEGHFSFKRCKLIIRSFKSDEVSLETIYNIPQQADDIDASSGYEQKLLDLMASGREPLVIEKGTESPSAEGLQLPEDVDRFLAVPLSIGGRVNGIFAAEGIILDDAIRFIILAHQFAMVLERIRLYELVQELAITDDITGVFVRRHFLERLAEEMERSKAFDTQLSFIMLDIDHFKRCNDKYGHLVGDVVLSETADIIKANLREIDLLGRYGGEEFSIILPKTSKQEAAVVGERLRKAVASATINAYDEKIKVSISAGIATFPDDTKEMNQLIDRADQMLYKAKESGRNRVEVYG